AVLPALRGARGGRLAAVGLPVRAGPVPAGRRGRPGRPGGGPAGPGHRAVVHRQHRHLAVRRVQHGRPDRPAQVHPAGAVRGGPDRRRRAGADRPPGPAAADPAGAGAHRGLLHHRHPAAVRGATGAGPVHAEHRQRVHAQPGRLRLGVHRQPVQRGGGAVGAGGAGSVRALLLVPRAGPPDGEEPMTAPAPARPAAAPEDSGARRRPRPAGPKARTKILVTAVLAVAAVYFLVPVYWVFVAATKSTPDLFGTFGFAPAEWNLGANLHQVLSSNDGIFLRWSLNSLLYSVVGGLGATLLSAAAGYAMAVYDFRGRRLLFGVILGGVKIPGTATALPLFLLFSQIGLADTYWAVLLPGLVSPFGLYLCRIYAEASVPASVIESGRVDGAGELRIFFAFGLRMMTPALVTVF